MSGASDGFSKEKIQLSIDGGFSTFFRHSARILPIRQTEVLAESLYPSPRKPAVAF